jgi:hypothetical protein
MPTHDDTNMPKLNGAQHTTQRNVRHWSSGEMGLRWTAAGMLESEKQFRKVIGYQDLAKLAVAIEQDLSAKRISQPIQEPTDHAQQPTRITA